MKTYIRIAMIVTCITGFLGCTTIPIQVDETSPVDTSIARQQISIDKFSLIKNNAVVFLNINVTNLADQTIKSGWVKAIVFDNEKSIICRGTAELGEIPPFAAKIVQMQLCTPISYITIDEVAAIRFSPKFE